MILVAECRDGVGSARFEETLRQAASPAELAATPEGDICLGGHTAIATARILQRCQVVVVSDLPRETVEGMHFTYAAGLDEALAHAEARHGPACPVYVMPHGGFILPVVAG